MKKDFVTIGIDVGGTTTRLVSYSSRRGVLSKAQRQTPKKGSKEFFLKLRDYISEVIPRGVQKIDGIGMGLAAAVDSRAGIVIAAPNLKFLEGVNVLKFLKLVSPNTVLVNDVTAIGTGELTIGAAKGVKNAVIVAIGTGIGGCVIINGKIYTGQGSAGQVGFMVLDNGKYFEPLAAGRTVVKGSRQEFARVAKYTGQAMASLVNVLDPELIVLSGGFVEDRAQQFLPQAEALMRSLVLSPQSARSVRVATGKLGDLAGATGAALLAQPVHAVR